MIKTCTRHGNYEVKHFNLFGREIEVGCPICAEESEIEEKRQAEAISELQRKNGLMARGIEPEYFGKTLADYKPENESETKALQACEGLAVGKYRKVVLLGSNGTGKTLLASVLAQSLNGVRITMYELSARIRAGYNANESELDILDGLLKFPFIAIDELGRTKGSDAEMNWLSYLIDKAHTRGIRLLLISNKHQAQNLPRERKTEAIEFFLPNDAISRLRQNSVIVEVQGRDRRAAFTAV